MLTLVLVDLWLLSVFVTLCLAVRGRRGLPEVKLRQPHHGYIGDALVLVGVLIHFGPVAMIGVVLRLDDTWQHFKQVVDESGYQSLVHRWYVKHLAPLRWVHRLQVWLDSL